MLKNKILTIIRRFSHTHSKTNIPSSKNNSIIVNSQFVKNLGFPSCSDCIYFVPSETYNPNHAKCRKFGKQNVINGSIDLSFADINREYQHLCGPNATYKETVRHNFIQILVPVEHC